MTQGQNTTTLKYQDGTMHGKGQPDYTSCNLKLYNKLIIRSYHLLLVFGMQGITGSAPADPSTLACLHCCYHHCRDHNHITAG